MRISDWSLDVCSSDLWGIEQSRNLMTVRAAAQTGMAHVVDLAKRMGVGDYPPYLSMALGAGETTVERMVNAFSVLANQGKWHDPTLIDFVQDRHGKVIWPANWRACAGCNPPDWTGKPEHTSELQSLMRISYAVFCLKKKTQTT